MEDLRPAFGRRLRRLRQQLGLSQEELAERAETHWTYVSGIERGQHNPGLNMIGRLARGLGLSASELLASVGESPRHKHRRQTRS